MPRVYRKVSKTGSQHCSVKMPTALLKRVDVAARKLNISRSHWMVQAAMLALTSKPTKVNA